MRRGIEQRDKEEWVGRNSLARYLSSSSWPWLGVEEMKEK